MLNIRRRILLASTLALAIFLLILSNFHSLAADRLRIFAHPAQHQNDTGPSHAASISESQPKPKIALETSQPIVPDKILVIAKLRWEDTNWATDNFPDWQSAIYTVDDPDAPLHTTRNKGREANAYLTYIIENYSNLPSILVFLHSHRKHDHGSRDVEDTDLDFDNVAALKALKIDFVRENGYANLRCIQNPGCPAEIQPYRPVEESDPLRPQERAMPDAWRALFENEDVPTVIATPCCAQFAVSKEQVWRRSREEYGRYLEWLLDTPLDDFTSGRVFEYLWHVIFGRDPVYCPDTEQCYHDLYGTSPPSPKPEVTVSSNFSVDERQRDPH